MHEGASTLRYLPFIYDIRKKVVWQRLFNPKLGYSVCNFVLVPSVTTNLLVISHVLKGTPGDLKSSITPCLKRSRFLKLLIQLPVNCA